MRGALILVLAFSLSGCGMSKAVRETGQTFDKYGCLAKQLKGETPCQPEVAQPQ